MSFIEALAGFMREVYPDYDILIRHEQRTIRVRKPTIILMAVSSSHEAYTIGYFSIFEESYVDVLYVYPGVPSIREAFETARDDVEKLRQAVMSAKGIGEYLVMFLEEQSFSDMYRMPGYIVFTIRLRGIRLSVRR